MNNWLLLTWTDVNMDADIQIMMGTVQTFSWEVCESVIIEGYHIICGVILSFLTQSSPFMPKFHT